MSYSEIHSEPAPYKFDGHFDREQCNCENRREGEIRGERMLWELRQEEII